MDVGPKLEEIKTRLGDIFGGTTPSDDM